MSQTNNTSTPCFSYWMVIFQHVFLVGKMFNLHEYSNQNNKIIASRIVSSQWKSLLSNWYFNYFFFYKESFELHNCISLLIIKKMKDCMIKCIIFNTNCYVHLITCHILNSGRVRIKERKSNTHSMTPHIFIIVWLGLKCRSPCIYVQLLKLRSSKNI